MEARIAGLTEVRSRILGAIVAGAVTSLTSGVAYWFGAYDIMKIAGFGAPIAAFVSLWIGPRVVRPGNVTSSVLLATSAVIGLGVVILTTAGIVGVTQGGSAAVFVYFPVVIWAVAISGLLMGVPIWLVVIGVLRWTGRRPRLGTALIALMVVASVVLGVVGLALNDRLMARRGADLRRYGEPPVALLLGRTTVSWSVANCSPWPYAITISDAPVIGGARLTRVDAPGLRTTKASAVVEPGWHLSLEVADASASIPSGYFGPHPVIDDVPGQVVEVHIEIGSRGEYASDLIVDGRTALQGGSLCAGAVLAAPRDGPTELRPRGCRPRSTTGSRWQ